MKLDWIMLANYAETPPATGLIYIMGGSWDTIKVTTPPENAAPDFVAALQGSIVMRLLFLASEIGRDHELEITIVDEDGGEVTKLQGSIRQERQPDLPPSWEHGMNLVFPVSGVGVPRFGLYTVDVLADGQYLGDRPFQVLKGY